jgi:RloB-like protein
MSKRKDKNRTPKYQQDENSNEPEKSTLLLVEGLTEKGYFDKLKANAWLKNSLGNITIEEGKISDIENNRGKYQTIWLVEDNDKRNAFVLIENDLPFWKANCSLPNHILVKLEADYIDDNHRYFLSIYDYLQWLKTVLGAEFALDYWDTIQDLTPIKSREWQQFENRYMKNTGKKQVKLAYSCVAFEFWLLLHFEQNKTPFLWVDKDKDATIDVVTYFKKYRSNYEKGDKKPCNAYTCLYDDYTKSIQKADDDWTILYRIITACANAKWLRNEMQPILERQNGKWYEVNPYIFGLDTLLETLLNLHYCNQEIEYQGAIISFEFDAANKRVGIKVISTQEAFDISEKDMKIKAAKQDFLPNKNETYHFPNAKTCYFYYEKLATYEKLVLVFKPNGFQKQLLVVLSEV